MSETSGLFDGSLLQLLTQTASAAPTPGGGSVAGIVGAFGISLIEMALRVTARKNSTGQMEALIQEGTRISCALRTAAQADIEAFAAYHAAWQLPKEGEAAVHRKTALHAAAVAAIDVPLGTARACLAGLAVGADAARLASPAILSDVLAGGMILKAGGEAALLNVDANANAKALGAKEAKDAKNEAETLMRGLRAGYVEIERLLAARVGA